MTTKQVILNGKMEHRGDFDYDIILSNGDRILLSLNDEAVISDNKVWLENEGSLQGYVFEGNKHDCYAVADFINNELAKANHKLTAQADEVTPEPVQADYESGYSGHWQSYSESTSYGRGNW